MKHIKLTLLFTVFMSMVVIASQAHDIEVPNSDGVIIYYNYTNNNTELSVTYEGNTFYDENNYSGSIVIPESVIYNGNTYMVTDIDINAFTACNNLTAITIPKSIKKIYDHSFTGCSSLKTIIIEDGTEELLFEPEFNYSGYQPKWYKENPLDSVYIGRQYKTSYYTYYPFREHPTLRAVAFGDEVKSIGDCAFRDCINLQSIKFGSQLEYIGFDAFWNSSYLDTIVISPSVKSIGSNAFYCPHISTLIIEEGEDLDLYNGEKGIEFKGISIDSLYLGRSNVNIVFKRIKHFTIGKIYELGGVGSDTINVLDIIEAPDTLRLPVYQHYNYVGGRINYYYTTPLNNKTIDSLYCNRIVSVYDTYNENSTVHPFEGVASSFILEIGKSLMDIGEGIFYGCKIPSLFIPHNIKRISPTAFNNCYTLSSVTIEDNTEPLDFGEGGNFVGCPLKNVYIGRNIQYTTNSPFYRNKEGIISLEFGENVTEIPENAFSGMKNLKTTTLPSNLQKIGNQSFYGCEGLATLSIPGSVIEIGMQAFDLCRGLTKITFEDGTGTLAFTAPANYLNNAFQNSPLEDIYLGRNISFTNSSPLSIFESLKNLTIGNEVTALPERAFIGCPNLKDVTSYSKVVPTAIGNVFTPSYLPAAVLHVPHALYDEYKVANVWKDFGKIVNFEGLYNLIYIVDGVEYKKYVIKQGSTITPEKEPEKEGCTFSGWSEIPETMPDYDVTVTGTFSINKYKLTYLVDGEEYKTYEVELGAAITPEEEPTKEGYTFSGWSEIPATMPAHDVTVTGTFSINKYKLTYILDNKEYKTYVIEYGAVITPEEEPTKEGYTFSGWSEIPETMPAHDVIVSGTFTINKYKLTYFVDGEVYKTYDVALGTAITPETEPEKEGYTFSGWSEIPETMPAHDVTVIGTFSINKYKLTYIVDDEEYKTYELEYGSAVTPEAEPTKEGHTFSGWVGEPKEMPAHDVTVTGKFKRNLYSLKYYVDGVKYREQLRYYGTIIEPIEEPTKEGYTFSGWSEIPETMPAHNVTVNGTFSINSYTLTYMIDEEVYKQVVYEYGATITPEPQPEGDYVSFEWVGVPETMPAHDVTVTAVYETGIAEIMMMAKKGQLRIYSPNGKKFDKLQKGLNIVVMQDGTIKKIVVK